MGKVEVWAVAVLLVVLLFTGSKKLPELARSVGESARELKNGFRDPEAVEVEGNKKASGKTAKK